MANVRQELWGQLAHRLRLGEALRRGRGSGLGELQLRARWILNRNCRHRHRQIVGLRRMRWPAAWLAV